jgi:hypothetical protein
VRPPEDIPAVGRVELGEGEVLGSWLVFPSVMLREASREVLCWRETLRRAKARSKTFSILTIPQTGDAPFKIYGCTGF